MGSALSLREVTLAYPGTRALDDVSIEFEAGSIHVLAGENGAGKSSLIRVLTGSRRPDRGSVLLDGVPVEFRGPADAAAAGIRAVPQELELFPSMPVWENVIAGRWGGPGLLVDRPRLMDRARAALDLVGEDLPPGARVEELSPAQQQRVMIARALASGARFLILDEATATLSRPEREALLERVRVLARSGLGVVFVSHHLEEAFAVGDLVSVLRDGALVWTRPIAEVDEPSLHRAMFGHEVAAILHRPALAGQAPPVLRLEQLRWGRGLHQLTLRVEQGEVVGVTGLPGSDADLLLRAVVEGPRRGGVMVGDRVVPPDPRRAIEAGIGYVPAERKSEGLFADLTARANVLAASLGAVSRRGMVDSARAEALARPVFGSLAIDPPDPERPARTFSGGNQQKMMLGRWFASQATVVLADEPTRGVDVATKEEIHRQLRSRSRGGAVVAFSSDTQELSTLADRTLVLRRDGSHAVLAAGASPGSIYAAMTERSGG